MNLDLKGKVFGVPVVYLAAGFVLILVAIAWKLKTPTGEDVAADPGLDDAGSQAGNDSEGDLGGENPNAPFVANRPPTYSSPAPQDATNPVVSPDTNEKWALRAAQWLAAGGKSTASEAQIAMNKYVNGDQLSYQQGQLRELAVKQFGLPPEPIQPGGTDKYNGPASRQGTPPTTHTVKGQSDDTFGEIAGLYYGGSGAVNVGTLYAANPTLSPTSVFSVGTRVTIPKNVAPKYYVVKRGVQSAQQIGAKNGKTEAQILHYNYNIRSWPVKVGTRVRVG